MRVLLQRRFRGNRNPAHLQEEEGTEDLQNEEELELEQEESSILELNPASVQLSVESRKYQQQEELLAQPPEFSAKGSNEAKLQQQHSSSPSFRKRRAPKENSNINNCKRSSRHTTEEPPLLLDTKPRARETNYIVRNPESSLDSSPEGLASAKPEAVSTSNTRGETTNIFKSTNNNNNNNRKMVSGGGGRNHHYHHNRSFRRQEEEEEHLNSAYGILNQHRQRHGLRLANAVRRRTDDNEPERYVEQQHLENDPASARGDIASSSPERENYNNFNRISELSSSATSVGDGSFVVLGREEPLLLESTSSLSTRMSSVPRTASMPVNSNFNNNNDRKRAPVEDIIRCGTESIDDLTAEEFRFRDVLKRERGLEIEEVDGDGNCLFRAISLQVYGDTTMHADVRQQCMDYMERDQEHFSQFVTGEPFFRYVARTRQDGVHGNNPEIQASSELFNRPIEVFTPQNGSAPLNIFHAEYKTGDVPIRLSYHDGNHYNAVIDPLAPTAGLGLGLPDLQPPGYADKMQMDKAMAESMNAKDEMELQQVMESSRREYQHQTGSDYNNKDSDDELQRAIKESRLSAEHMNSNNALSLSDMDATYFDLEQAALEHSLQPCSQTEEGKKQRASITKTDSDNSSSTRSMEPKPTTRGDRKSPAVPASLPSSSSDASLPCPSQESIPVAATAAASSPAAAQKSEASPPERLLPVEDYPANVQDLVMNGFPLSTVVNAYSLVGNNFDDMLSLCFAKTNGSGS